MQVWGQRTSGLGLASLGVAGLWALAGLFAGFAPEVGQSSELSPSEIVALRFPSNWEAPAAPTGVPLASAAPAVPAAKATSQQRLHATPGHAPELVDARDAVQTSPSSIFSPYPLYTVASASSEPVRLPEQALGYADTRSEAAAAVRATPAPAERRAAIPARPKEPSGLFNTAQLASIKERLQLSAQQEQMWPPVEAALRAIGYRYNRETQGGRKGETRTATVAPTSEEVQRLKSAAIPLIMTMREDQKREVRSLVHLLGLEQLAAQF
jgi:hypothetical protein